MATVTDDTDQVGFNFHGNFSLLEEFLAIRVEETKKQAKEIKELQRRL